MVVVLNKTVKMLLGSGLLLVLLWVALLVFSASSIKPPTNASSQPYKQSLNGFKRKVDENIPDTPWRKVSLEDLEIPESAKELAKTLKAKPARLPVKGVETFTFTVLPKEEKSNLTFLFLHGAAFKAQDWLDLGTLHLMAALGYKTVAVDLPGFGGTQGKLGADKDTYVSKVDYFTELVKVAEFPKGKVVLVTPSFSGNYALPYILTHPEMCSGLIAVAPAASGIVPQSRLRALQVPTMLVYGAKDGALGKTSHEDLRVIPNFQAKIIQDAGHACYIDQPDKFHKLVYNFVQKLDSGVSKK